MYVIYQFPKADGGGPAAAAVKAETTAAQTVAGVKHELNAGLKQERDKSPARTEVCENSFKTITQTCFGRSTVFIHQVDTATDSGASVATMVAH